LPFLGIFGREAKATRPLLWLVLTAVAVPILLFFYGSWATHEKLKGLVGERIERTLDILQEHALKVLQTTERLLYEADQLLADIPDKAIEARETELSDRLKDIQQAVPEVQSIWAFDREGRSLVSSTVVPIFGRINNADRDYFKALQAGQKSVYVDKNVKAKIGDLTFFVVSRPRSATQGSFNGIIALTLPPKGLNEFYEKVARGSAIAAGLFRDDGSVLARYPTPPGEPGTAQTNVTFLNALVRSPLHGSYITRSGVDGIDRVIAYRKLPGYRVYVTAAYEQSAIWKELFASISQMLMFGLPATMFLALVGWLALRRTASLVAEYEGRQRAEQALKQAQRLEALGRLTGGVAHDFNNLLMVVRGNAERLLRPCDLNSKQERAVRSIMEASGHGEKLTRQLLAFSRRSPIKTEVIDLRERVPQLEEMLRTSLTQQIKLGFEFPNDVWPIEADPADLDLAILNLSVNARDAMPDGGTLTLGARNASFEKGQRVELFVRDSGSGISEEHLHRVFDPFFTTKPPGRGTGLGLSQVYGFVTQIGGDVSITTKTGHGTEVQLSFPRSIKAKALEPDEKPTLVGRELKILFVEDNAAIAEVTKANLEADGHEVTLAIDGDHALRVLRSDKFDLVFSDIVMPGAINGIELARRLKEAPEPVPVILATGYSEEAERARREGYTIINKPYALSTLRREFAQLTS
jgi:two-component system NtrC family sensor kinase